MSYDCLHCGAVDSGYCAFTISDRLGTVVAHQQDAAREVGCRVMHYTDMKKFKEES